MGRALLQRGLHQIIERHACRVFGLKYDMHGPALAIVSVGRMCLGPFQIKNAWGCRVSVPKVCRLEFYGKTKTAALEAAGVFMARHPKAKKS
jgi:hypothetical protein